MGKKILYGFLIFFSLLVLSVIGFYIYLIANSGDIEKIDDSALTPSSQILSKEDNAFFDFKEAGDKLVIDQSKSETIKDLASGLNWDDAFVNQLVAENSAALETFDRGSWKKGYQDPSIQAGLETLNASRTLTPMSNLRSVSNISAIKSRILLKQGKEKEAFDNSLNILYAGQLVQNSPRTTLIHYLIGLAVKKIGLSSIQNMIPDSHLASDELKNYSSKLEKFKENKAGLQETFKMEYTMLNNTKEQMVDKYMNTAEFGQTLDSFSSIKDEKLPINKTMTRFNFYYKPNKTQKLFFETYQNFVINSTRSCNNLIPEPQKPEFSKTKVLFTENAVGKILNSVIAVSLNSVFNKRCEEEFSVVKTQIALAAQAYRNDNGAYPSSISQLYPGYLGSNYTQFDGKNIIYDAKTGTVSLPQ